MLAAGGPVGKSVSLLNKQSALILVLAMLAAAAAIKALALSAAPQDALLARREAVRDCLCRLARSMDPLERREGEGAMHRLGPQLGACDG